MSEYFDNDFSTSITLTALPMVGYNNICLEGGGLRGMAFLGVDKYFTEKQLWPNFKRFIGSSCGSIFAAIAACNIHYPDIINIIENTDYSKFLDSGYLPSFYRFLRYKGFYPGNYFYNWLGNILSLTGNSDITFLQVFQKFGNELVITGSSLTDRKAKYFTKDNYPNMPIRLAVRISISVPMIFEPIVFDNQTWVDGGYINNYPINYFKVGETLGFKLISSITGPYITNTWSDFITNLLETASQRTEQLEDKKINEYRTVDINTFNIDPLKFDLTKQEIDTLIRSGYQAVYNFFNPN